MFLYLWFGILLLLALCYFKQHYLIYHMRRYSAAVLSQLDKRLVRISFKTGEGEQLAFYLPPAQESEAGPLWLLFGGNASRALDWLPFIKNFPNPSAHFLLIDYPGCGACAGTPSPETIKTSSEEAFLALCRYLKQKGSWPVKSLNLLGYSLGSAAALLFAAPQPVQRIVLLAPFTSMMDMAQLRFGSPLCKLLTHRYNNLQRIYEILQRPFTPLITIIHGEEDEVVPVYMSRRIASLFPGVGYLEVAASHNNLLSAAQREIQQAMGA